MFSKLAFFLLFIYAIPMGKIWAENMNESMEEERHLRRRNINIFLLKKEKNKYSLDSNSEIEYRLNYYQNDNLVLSKKLTEKIKDTLTKDFSQFYLDIVYAQADKTSKKTLDGENCRGLIKIALLGEEQVVCPDNDEKIKKINMMIENLKNI